MNLNRIRPYTTLALALIWILMVLTGVLLYLAPQGPGSRQWLWLGISKHEFKDIHFYLGMVAVACVIFHGFLNVNALKKYLLKHHNIWTHPVLWSVIGVFAIVLLALY